MAGRKSILVVEDETDLADLVCYHLEREGFEPRRAEDGERALAEAGRHVPDLVVLDRMLPKLSGDEVLRRLRRDDRTATVPVIMLTAKVEEADELVGLALGADDYLRKPFSIKILLAHISAVLRRDPGASPPREVLSSGGVTLDRGRHEVSLHGDLIDLTATEFRILAALMAAKGRVMSREQLIELTLGQGAAVTNRAMDVHIAALRRKLGPAATAIQTIRGVGYAFRYTEQQAAAEAEAG